MLSALWHFVMAVQADHYKGQSIHNIFWRRVREESSDAVMWTVQRTVLLPGEGCASFTINFPALDVITLKRKLLC